MENTLKRQVGYRVGNYYLPSARLQGYLWQQ